MKALRIILPLFILLFIVFIIILSTYLCPKWMEMYNTTLHTMFWKKLEESVKYGHIVVVEEPQGTVLVDTTKKMKDIKDIKDLKDLKEKGLEKGDGVIIVSNKKRFVHAVLHRGEVGLGEMYRDGVWTSPNLSSVMMVLCRNMTHLSEWNKRHSVSSLDKHQDKENIMTHYDVGNDFYETFLVDPFSAYTCAFWSGDEHETLASAQKRKIDTMIRKLGITSQDTDLNILDLGCGWGLIAEYVFYETNKKHRVTGVTISDEQVKASLRRQQDYEDRYPDNQDIALVKEKVRILNMDYRDLPVDNPFDIIYSIGMVEHIRAVNYPKLFHTIHKILKPRGRFVLHTIVWGNPLFPEKARMSEEDYRNQEDRLYVSEHIFPGGQIPRVEWIVRDVHKAGMSISHMEIMGGEHYAKTLHTWKQSMLSSPHRHKLENKYGAKLYRSFEYYMTACEAMFRTGYMNVAHFIITNESHVSAPNLYTSL